jgi:hypothetical protein
MKPNPRYNRSRSAGLLLVAGLAVFLPQTAAAQPVPDVEPFRVTVGPAATQTHVTRVLRVGDDSLTVQLGDTEKMTYRISPRTDIILNRKAAYLSDLQAGDTVRVTTSPAAPRDVLHIMAARLVITPPTLGATDRQARTRRTARNDIADRSPDDQGGLGVVVADSPGVGVLVLYVQSSGPAERAGIQAGDYILRIEDQDVERPEEFLNLIAAQVPRERSRIDIWRNGQDQTLRVMMGNRQFAHDDVVQDTRFLLRSMLNENGRPQHSDAAPDTASPPAPLADPNANRWNGAPQNNGRNSTGVDRRNDVPDDQDVLRHLLMEVRMLRQEVDVLRRQ